MLNPQQQAAIRCKLSFNGELRCCALALPPSWDALQADVARLFNIGPAVGRAFVLKYVDDEGDSVTFDSPLELHDAVHAAAQATTPNPCLKLLVQLVGSVVEKAPTGEPLRAKCRGKRGAFHQFGPGEMEALLDQLEARGFGQRRKRNARLLRKMGGDVEAVMALLRESDAAAGQRRLARKQKKLALAHADGRPHKSREERKEERKAKRAEKKNSKDAIEAEGFVSLADGWPAGVSALYLDGNNMLFLTSALRRHALGRGQRWRAEAMLTSLAESFARAKRATGLCNTVMIYDSINKRRCGVKNLDEGARFAVASARPEFATSDDALVAWAQALPPQQVKASLFVTSDRELKNRLLAVGALVAKPKQWVELARRTIEDGQTDAAFRQPQGEGEPSMEEAEQLRPETEADEQQSLDDFLEEWGKKLVLHDYNDHHDDDTTREDSADDLHGAGEEKQTSVEGMLL